VTILPLPSLERASPIDAILDLLERLTDLDARLSHFERAVADAADPVGDILHRIESIESQLASLVQKQRRPNARSSSSGPLAGVARAPCTQQRPRMEMRDFIRSSRRFPFWGE
jgi:hypothetical protein